MAILTATYNGNTIINTTSDGTFTLPTAGKYMNTDVVLTASEISSLTVSYNGSNIVNASADGTFTLKTAGTYMSTDVVVYVIAEVQTSITATVSNVGSQNPSDVVFNVDPDFTVAGIGITEWTDGSGNVFIKIPTLYRKINSVSSNQITSFTISTAAIDNTYQPYSVFVDENGNLLDYVCIGKYWNTSSSSMISQSQSGAVSMTIGNARTFARVRGAGYQQYDWQFQKLWQDLIVVFKRTYNTNSGTAWTYDEMGIYWGTKGCWIDGICHNSGVIAVSYNPSKYVDRATTSTDGYTSVSYGLPANTTSSLEVQTLGYDANNPFVQYPSAVTANSSYNTFYCDSYYYTSGSHPVLSSVGYAGAGSGAFRCYALYNWSYSLSVRLCYRPLSA